MLHNCLTGTERTGNSGHTALGDGEHRIDNTLTGDQRRIRNQLLLVGTAHTNRPLLHQCQWMFCTIIIHNHANGLFYRVGTTLNGLDRTLNPVRNHNLLLYHAGLLNGANDIAGNHLITDLGSRNELPLFLSVQSGNRDTSGNIRTGHLYHAFQWTLDTIIHRLDQAGTQFHRKGSAGTVYF